MPSRTPSALQASAAALVPAHTQSPPASEKVLLWDIFCKVIDNYGDVGVCWRLAAQLALRGHSVRLWLDDLGPVQWLAPGAAQGSWPGISVHNWPSAQHAAPVPEIPLADVWIEAFGCDIPPAWLQSQVDAADTQGRRPAWINLEYLSAEPFALRSHGLPSPVLQGPAKTWTKYFFYPGWTHKTGGLLREPWIKARQALLSEASKTAWLQRFGVTWKGEKLISLFCYESAAVSGLLDALGDFGAPLRLLVTEGQAKTEVQKALRARSEIHSLEVSYLPTLSQTDYDQLLWACDLNFVRGEDSLVRAIWAGKPLVWHIYPQEDDAHHAKLDAFLSRMDAPPSLHLWHHYWNGLVGQTREKNLNVQQLAQWHTHALAFRDRLESQPDLTQQLIEFVASKREALK